PLLLQASRRSTDVENPDAGREIRKRLILEGYLGYLAGEQGGAREASTAEAFRIADAARGSSVQRALTQSVSRAAIDDRELAQLVRQEQDAEKQIAALNSLYASAVSLPPDQQDGAALKSLSARIDQLRGARATLRQEIEKRYPDYVRLIDPRPSTVTEVQAA